MVKRLTSKQKQARKRQQYYIREYKTTLLALKYMEVEYKPAKYINKKTLATIRKRYTKEVKKRKAKGWIDIPTKREMARKQKFVEWENEHKFYDGIKPLDSQVEENTLAVDYIIRLETLIKDLTSVGTVGETRKKEIYDTLRLNDKKMELLDMIELFIVNNGVTKAAEIFSSNEFIQRIENIDEKYAYEMIDSIKEDLFPLIHSSIKTALK